MMMADSSRTSSSSSSSFVDSCSSLGASSSVFDTDSEQILQGTCEVSGSESPPQNKRYKLTGRTTGHYQSTSLQAAGIAGLLIARYVIVFLTFLMGALMISSVM